MTSTELTELKSSPPIENSLVRFINLCRHDVDVLWVNYEGSRIRYTKLAYKKFFDVNTFVGHPWVFCNSATGDQMVIHVDDSKSKFSSVYWPRGYDSNVVLKRRRIVFIMLPVYSLTECCFQAIRNCGITKESIAQSFLPQTIQDDFKVYLTETEKQRECRSSR